MTEVMLIFLNQAFSQHWLTKAKPYQIDRDHGSVLPACCIGSHVILLNSFDLNFDLDGMSLHVCGSIWKIFECVILRLAKKCCTCSSAYGRFQSALFEGSMEKGTGGKKVSRMWGLNPRPSGSKPDDLSTDLIRPARCMMKVMRWHYLHFIYCKSASSQIILPTIPK